MKGFVQAEDRTQGTLLPEHLDDYVGANNPANEEIKRRTRVVRIFPNVDSCLRLIRALCVEMHGPGWRTTAI